MNKQFKEKWEEGLEQYLRRISANDSVSRINGFTRCHKNGIAARHGYIINKLECESNLEIIKKYNLLSHPEDFAKLIGKVDKRDLHLNSSQVMCYNFFRNMMAKETTYDKELGWYGYASSALIKFIKKEIGATISEKAKCKFEYEDKATQLLFKSFTSTGRGERSQYDFYISDGDINIYFEIKYTEDNFGSWSPKNSSKESMKNHEIYLSRGYRPMVEKSIFLTQDCKERILKDVAYTDPRINFNRFYQLFRNTLRANKDNNYSVFILPNVNPGPKTEFELFENNFLTQNHNHIIPLYWENLSQYMSPQFYEKYISFFNE